MTSRHAGAKCYTWIKFGPHRVKSIRDMAVTSKWPLVTSSQLHGQFWALTPDDLWWPLTRPWCPQGQMHPMDQVWSRLGQGLRRYGPDLKMTSDDLGSTPRSILSFDPQMTFGDLWPRPWHPQGQTLPMDQIWSGWGQGLRRYGRDLKMTYYDLESTPRSILSIDLQMTFGDLWPQMTPLRTLGGAKCYTWSKFGPGRVKGSWVIN